MAATTSDVKAIWLEFHQRLQGFILYSQTLSIWSSSQVPHLDRLISNYRN